MEQAETELPQIESSSAKQPKAYAGTQLIARSFQLLRMFDDERNEWQLNDLVQASGLKKTTAFRILTALELEGMVQRTAQGGYALGSEVIAMGGRAMRANPLRKVARPYLHTLVDQSLETATLEVLWIDAEGNLGTIVMDEIASPKLLGVTQYIGMHFPVHVTSTGKAILAYETPERIAQLLPRALPALTEQSITSPAQLLEELEMVRTQGFALSCHELEQGIVGVSAPIFNHNNQVLAALCASGPSSRISPERQCGELATLVCRLAKKISEDLGWRSRSRT